jgi:predicted  nucleic acid-binding Zn-ribbon protein
MSVMMKRILIIFLFLFVAHLSFGEAYKWVDEKGALHFTDDIMQIPEQYRPTAERIGLTEEKIDTKMEDKSLPKGKEDTYKDRLGRGEEFWKARVEEWRKKLTTSQERLEKLRVKYNELTEKFNDSKSSIERANFRKERDQMKNEIDQCRNEIEEARSTLEKKIPEEADLDKAKLEWIK